MADVSPTKLPSALAQQTRFERLGSTSVPALLAHPDWERPAPVVIWMHGRNVSKELDNGRYLRWIRAGIAACAIDLPGHGERFEARLQEPGGTLEVVKRAVGEVDGIVAALGDVRFKGVFDLTRVAIGGMSAGGMVTLRRLCDPPPQHSFVCASVEGTAGDLGLLYGEKWRGAVNPPEKIAELDPMRHIAGWRPIPLLALHSEADEVVPVECIRVFVEALRERYKKLGAEPGMVELVTWPETGAPAEHSGFGRVANEAKTRQVEFFRKWLGEP